MYPSSSSTRSKRPLVLILMLVVFSGTAPFVLGQTPGGKREQAIGLMKQQKYTEALPLLEEIVKGTPDDAVVQYYLGFALLGQSTNTGDQTVAQSLRARARKAFVRAQQLGDESELVAAMIEGIPEDGGQSPEARFSQNPEAERLMSVGEAAFSRGEMDKALSAYQDALRLDPKLYYAALFSGDVHMQRGKFADAEIWYQKAITINPYIETAYRYSATPLMKQGKYDQARDRYIEAYIVDPYNRLAAGGLIQWAQATRTSIGHPQIDIPKTTVGSDGKSNTTINVNPLADDGSMAWIAYTATRETWKKEKFLKMFPSESAYRHSVAEEVDALRSVVTTAKTLKAKKLHPHILLIEKMDKEEVLEAYVLIALADREIAREYPAYLRKNRDKLRRYVANYVIAGSGN